MKIVLLLTLLLWGNIYALSQFESSKVCQKCHPIIYKEHFSSAHRKSSIFNDPIHKAIWDKHPLKAKEKYKCAKCHTPNDKELITALAQGKKALPQKNRAQLEEGVSCVSCHNITSVQKHAKTNTNIITKDKKTLYSARESEKSTTDKAYKTTTEFFGLVTKESGSPFHNIDFSNELYYNGNLCLGCHEHKQNSHGFDVCNMQIDEHPNTQKENCITCHMPKVAGSFSTMTESKTHRYHGFTGSMHKPKMLMKYVDISFKKSKDGFDILIKNKANHALLLHPLRVGVLKVSLKKEQKVLDLKPVIFIRVIGKDAKPSMPWVANEVVKDTQIQAKELRVIHFDTPVQSGDTLDVRLGHYIVNPKAAKKLGLSEYKEYTKFTLLKEESFDVK